MPEQLWHPCELRKRQAQLHAFIKQVRRDHPSAAIADDFDYDGLHRWSVGESEAFWQQLLGFTGILCAGSTSPVRGGDRMPAAPFFPEVTLNFAENLLRHAEGALADAPALVSIGESRPTHRLTFSELRREVARVAAGLAELGIEAGDRVAGYIPNIEEAVIAMLAAASLGALWTSSSPDFGMQGVLDRFGQVKPRVLFAANGYTYNGKRFDCLPTIAGLAAQIDSIERVVLIPYLSDHATQLAGAAEVVLWDDFGSERPLQFVRQPFNAPLYVMYSSGTTGIPKCIVHGQGGTLLQHAKELLLHCDLKPRDNIMYFTTTGWMMWNWLVSSLFVGATVTLFDGSPAYPGLERLWQVAQDEKLSHFGTSPKFIGSCRGNLSPRRAFNLDNLRSVLSTGAPLLPEDFDWIYAEVKEDLQLSSISGGTDIISCFMLGNPLLPVYRGEIQCIGLGMDVAAVNEAGVALIHEKGELVCRQPFVSAPVGFWNDPDNSRYLRAYFPQQDGIWHHGDYIELTSSQGSCGGVVVYGRSDATLNPGGIRIGTAEIYRLVETMDAIEDSIVVGQAWQGDVRVVLFVKLRADTLLDDALMADIKRTIRNGSTPRHVPAKILAVPDIPYTISGKKVELAVREIIEGREPNNRSALKNPEALDLFKQLDALAL